MKRLAFPLLVLLVLATAAHGFGGLFRRAPATSSSSYYYVQPLYIAPLPQPFSYPCPPPVQPFSTPPPVFQPPVQPMQPATTLPATPPIVVPGPYAPPSAAPPSLTPEPVETSTSMRVNTGTKYYDLFPTASGKEQTDRCSVAVWNLTGRTLTVSVNGQNKTLTNGQSVTLDVPRSFRWQVEGRGVETVQMAASDKGADILIRK